jgi:hypothetical protein
MSGFGGDTNNFGGGGGFGTPLANNSNSNSNNNNNNNNNPFGGGGFGGSSGTTNATPLFGSGSGFGSGGGDAPITSFASAVPFGGSNIAPPPSSSFGGGGGGGMSFGSSPNVLPTGGVSGFGGGRFGGSQNQNNNQYQQQQQQHQNPSSFGGAPFQSQQQSSSSSNQQSLSFGSSSNVMVGNNAPTSTGLNNDNSSGPGNSERSSGFGSDLSSKGKSNNMNNPFGGGGGGGGGGFVSSTNSPFGGGGRSATMPPTIPDNSGNVVYNRTNNNTMGDDNDHNNSNNNINPANTYVRPRTSINSAHAQMEEKKRILTAKIEEKKRRLAERQQRKKREEEESGRRSKSPTMQSASPTPPMPMRTASPKPPMRMNQPNQQQPPRTNQQQTLAERNALRFASTPSVTVRARSPITTTTTSSTSNNSTGREDLHQAVNLVGICMTMCPTDELQTRRNENDIQAMEIAMPGRLHPSNWTQQDTAVKRFRRSAADFKLDVPEWVRPPEVLEQTMGYLEEWIMERDRQGPDPRFPQPDLPPPPLDVYQFIWDRTRMIRKDFILQNYVGTGGRCDARAVRCHERIARWHAMCEHQLSHIPDFVKMQSQQNVQELGQTMKSLNGFYDDALNRSTIEVPDERTGIETYVSDQNITTNDTVQGRDPVDYNGSSLNNASDNPMIARRLIGKNSNKTIGRGTAEPEMRAIYILLTMGNEGGMEVLKYAAKLFQERPAVYHSPPVQLAISIFKAKKDSNYVKFFSIMRSSSTPYLFCCIMFKMVEEMRKYAFRVMYKAYGGRTVNGEAKYDHYPLKRLVQVLNFEDMDEARNACNHYNITVKEYEHESGEISEIIYWKGSKYREAKHPEKGHTLPLPPRKMMRTIEIKLNGTTRLGVCRGDKSGKGAALSGPAPAPVTRSTLNPNSTSFVPRNSDTRALSMTLTTDTDNEMDSKAMELLMKQKLERIKLEKQQKERKEKERRAQEERQRQENKQKEEERRLEEIERRNQAEIEKRRCEQKLKEEQARQKRLKEEEERAIQQREEEKARKIAEEKAHKEVAEARKRKELELQRQREQKEQQRRELERRLADEKRRKELEENEKRRKEEEERRLEALRLELEAKRRKEAEEKRKADEWQDKINAATKVLVWHRLRRALSRPLEIAVGSRVSLQAIDPLYKTDSFHLMDTLRMAMEENLTKIQAPLYTRPTTKSVVEEVLQKEASKLAIADMALREIESLSTTPFGSRKSTLLFKIAVICPETMDVTDQSFANLLYHWIDTRVKLGNIETAKSNANSSMEHEVRVVVVRGSSYEVCSTCDIALFIIPPKWTDPIQNAAMLGQVASSILPDDIPRVALVLSDNVEENRISTINNAIAKELGGNMETLPIIHPSQLSVEGFDNALLSAFKRVMKIFVREACVSVIRISAMQLATKTILTVLWKCVPSVSSGLDVDEDVIVECSRLALRFMMQELAKRSTHNKAEWSLWPAPEFACKDNLVESYFTKNDGLPLEWIRNLGEDFLEKTYEPLLTAFQGHFRDVYQRIVVDAPIIVQDDCATECAQGQYRRCLEKSLLWMQSASGDCYLYLPEGMIELVVNDVVSKVRANPVLSQTSTNRELDVPLLAAEDLTDDDLSFATATATATATNAPASISSNKRSRTKTQSEKDDDIRFAECTERESKKHRRQPLTTTTATNESDSFTKKLERLLRGDKTTIDDVIVGDTTLSRILRNVPEL